MNKILHYFFDDINIWKKSSSPHFRMCYASWKKFCPDYEIKLWHTEMPEFQDILKRSKFVSECYKRKMYALIADYVRYYALYRYGGIYIDTDVQLLDNFDKYLDKEFFVSIEADIIDGHNIPEPAVVGGEKGCEIFKSVLDIYETGEIFSIDFPIANLVLAKVLKEKYNFSKIGYSDSVQDKLSHFYNPDIPIIKMNDFELYRAEQISEFDNNCIYPSEYFCPSWNAFGEKAFTENTVAIHWGQCSWWNKKNKFRELQSFRYKNPIKRFWYKYSEKFAKLLTFWILHKGLRRKIRDLLTFN